MSTEDLMKGLIIGGVAGLALGILYAPKSGKETRQQITDSTEELLNKARIQYEDARKKIAEIVDDKKESVLKTKDKLKKAVDAGVEVYKQESTEMHQA